MIENSLKIENYKPRREVGKPTVSSALKILALLVVLLVFPLSASASARLQMPPNYLVTNSGLVGYWTFDGKDTNWGTNKTNDLSGQGNTGTLTNMSTTTSPVVGKIGQGLKFDGVDDYVLSSGPNFGSVATVSLWFKPNVTLNSSSAVVSLVGSNQRSGLSLNHTNCGAADGSIRLLISPFAGANSCVNTTTKTWTAGEWYHVVATYNGSIKVIYLN